MSSSVRLILTLVLLATVPVAGAVWLISIEEVQGWAISGAGDDPLAQFEAVGTAEAAWWCLRVFAPVLVLLAAMGMWYSRAVARFVTGFWNELLTATRVVRSAAPSVPDAPSVRDTYLFRACLVCWLALAIYHGGQGIMERLRDWPIYRLNPGSVVLPNMSPGNREVIRYVSHATPPGARILVLSDQRLFFLSYYLLPRRVYHPLHPGGEFVIPQPNGVQQLPAYRLSELDADYLRSLKPDYVLEYFEGPAYVDATRLSEDAQWLAFERQRLGPEFRPEFLVSLRPFSAVSLP